MTQEVRLGPIFSKSGGKRQNVSPSLAFSSHLQILRKYCTMHYPNLAFVHSRCYLLLIIYLPPCSANKSWRKHGWSYKKSLLTKILTQWKISCNFFHPAVSMTAHNFSDFPRNLKLFKGRSLLLRINKKSWYSHSGSNTVLPCTRTFDRSHTLRPGRLVERHHQDSR